MATSQTLALLDALYAWWQEPGPERQSILAEDLSFIGNSSPGDTKDDFIWWVEQKPAWRDLKVIERFGDGSDAALVFEGTDPVTELRHRVSWLVHIANNRVARVVETMGTIGRGG